MTALLVSCARETSEEVTTGGRPQTDVPAGAWQRLPVENVNPADGEFGDSEQTFEAVSEFAPLAASDALKQSDAVVRVVTEPVTETLGDYASPMTPEGRSINAFFVQGARVTEVVGVADDLSSDHAAALDSGTIEIIINGPNTLSPTVVETIKANQVALPAGGTGAYPAGVELLVYLRTTTFPGFDFMDVESDRVLSAPFISTAGSDNSVYYVDGDAVIRPTLPLVSDLPGLVLSEVNRASIREAAPINFEEFGVPRAQPIDSAVPDVAAIGTASPGDGASG